MELTKASWKDVSPILDSIYTAQNRPVSISTEYKSRKLVEPRCIERLRKPATTYIKDRGLDPVYLEDTWGIQMTGPLSDHPWRLYIPICMYGQVVSWTTRAIHNSGGLRYISAGKHQELIDHKKVLYGADLAKNCIIVVEGPADVWKIGPGAVATFGLNLSLEQLREIVSYPRVCICPDSGGKEMYRAKELADQIHFLSGGDIPEIVELETGSDPGGADPEEIRELRRIFLE
jgi:hypothetical protein